MSRLLKLLFACLLPVAFAGGEETAAIVPIETLAAPEAKQAACADERFVYAIDSKSIAKYDRASHEKVATSTGNAKHLNSGFLWNGKIYCAHSNYPAKPERSEIMELDSETMVLTIFKNFGEYRGSLTWVVRDGDVWWCNFARYGAENAQTVLVKLDAQWQELGTWTYPDEVIQELGQYSISGGFWLKSQLLVTGHDHKIVYRLSLPEAGSVLRLIDKIPSPFPGQGIAFDPKTSGLIGIDRDQRQVIFARMP